MNKILDILLPRFITEEVALRDDGDHLVIACALADVKAGEEFPAIATVRAFNLFGLALFPKMIGEPRDWPSAPHNTCSECGFMWAYGESAKHSCALHLAAKAAVRSLGSRVENMNPEPVLRPAVSPSFPDDSRYTYCTTQATRCAGCGKHKHTPLRVDWMGGYVCLTCIDKKLDEQYDQLNPDEEDVRPADTLVALLALLRRVEQMAAYYEAPKGFFDWLDQQVTLHGGTPNTPEPAGFRIGAGLSRLIVPSSLHQLKARVQQFLSDSSKLKNAALSGFIRAYSISCFEQENRACKCHPELICLHISTRINISVKVCVKPGEEPIENYGVTPITFNIGQLSLMTNNFRYQSCVLAREKIETHRKTNFLLLLFCSPSHLIFPMLVSGNIYRHQNGSYGAKRLHPCRRIWRIPRQRPEPHQRQNHSRRAHKPEADSLQTDRKCITFILHYRLPVAGLHISLKGTQLSSCAINCQPNRRQLIDGSKFTGVTYYSLDHFHRNVEMAFHEENVLYDRWMRKFEYIDCRIVNETLFNQVSMPALKLAVLRFAIHEVQPIRSPGAELNKRAHDNSVGGVDLFLVGNRLTIGNPYSSQYRRNRPNRLHPCRPRLAGLHRQHQDEGQREHHDHPWHRRVGPEELPYSLAPHSRPLAISQAQSLPSATAGVQREAA